MRYINLPFDSWSRSILYADEVPNCVLVGDGGGLQLFDAAFVFQVCIHERDVSGAMCLGEHRLELDLREAPSRVARSDRLPHMADECLAHPWPAFSMAARGQLHGTRKAFEVGPVGSRRTRQNIGTSLDRLGRRLGQRLRLG